MKLLKIVGIVILAIVIINIIANAPKRTATPEAASVSPIESATTTPVVEILQTDETIESVTKSRIVHAQVKNNSDKLITYLDLKSIYKGKDGKIVGTGIGNATNIAGGATKVVDILAMGVENASGYNVEIGNVIYK